MTLDLISAIGIIAGTALTLMRGSMTHAVAWLLGVASALILMEGLCGIH